MLSQLLWNLSKIFLTLRTWMQLAMSCSVTVRAALMTASLSWRAASITSGGTRSLVVNWRRERVRLSDKRMSIHAWLSSYLVRILSQLSAVVKHELVVVPAAKGSSSNGQISGESERERVTLNVKAKGNGEALQVWLFAIVLVWWLVIRCWRNAVCISICRRTATAQWITEKCTVTRLTYSRLMACQRYADSPPLCGAGRPMCACLAGLVRGLVVVCNH